jgi:hypothetical protein
MARPPAVRATGAFVESHAHVDAGGPAKNSESSARRPPTTVAFAEGHDVGEQVT